MSEKTAMFYKLAFRRGLEEAATRIAEGFNRPGIKTKHDRCAHDKFGWEDCEQCCVVEIRRLASLVEEIELEDNHGSE